MRFAAQSFEAGDPAALVVATNITGGTLRAPGALMAVTQSGRTAGYMSNGCVDADIIFQAKQALEDGQPRTLIYGDGSPFKDITLPCGGRMTLRVLPRLDADDLGRAITALENRQPYKMAFETEGHSHTYHPKIRLRIAGKGEAIQALAAQAQSTGFDVIIQSPEENLTDGFDSCLFDHLNDPSTPPERKDDPWTAFILMFHDHDWEPHFLKQVLNGPAFYIGAMGSVRTHAARRETLSAMGFNEEAINRVKGPIGLIPSMRDANLLALSTLADVVKAAQECGRL